MDISEVVATQRAALSDILDGLKKLAKAQEDAIRQFDTILMEMALKDGVDFDDKYDIQGD